MATNRAQPLTTASGRPAAWGTRIRERIDSSMVVDKLQAHVLGQYEMTQTQINAARILLNRTVPELKAIEVSINSNDIKDVKHYSAHDLLSIIEGESERRK